MRLVQAIARALLWVLILLLTWTGLASSSDSMYDSRAQARQMSLFDWLTGRWDEDSLATKRMAQLQA